MITGIFVEDMPFIRVSIAWGNAVQSSHAVLDTGFTGDLQVTPKIAKVLGLQINGVTSARIASGDVVQVPTALAIVSMEGVVKYIQVLIADSIPLAGISFLSKFNYKVMVDCKNKTITMEMVA